MSGWTTNDLRCIVCTGAILPDGQRPITVEALVLEVDYRGQRGYAHGSCSVLRDGGLATRGVGE